MNRLESPGFSRGEDVNYDGRPVAGNLLSVSGAMAQLVARLVRIE